MSSKENTPTGSDPVRGNSRNKLNSSIENNCSGHPLKNQRNPYQLAMSTADLRKLNTKIDYIVDGLIPKDFITLLYAPSGMGKSTLITQLCQAVQDGKPFLGLATIKTPTFYVDYENPTSVISERLNKIGAGETFHVWTHGCSTPPPQIDNAESRECLFDLEPGTLLVIDTLKASNNQDENSSTQMKPIFDFFKSLRTHGLTIIILHHTAKGHGAAYRGSSVIMDQSDHCLSLDKSKLPSNYQKAVGKETYRLGTQDKTRARPFEMFIAFDPDQKHFVDTESPDIASMSLIEKVINQITQRGEEANQKRIVEIMRSNHELPEKETRRLLKDGVGLALEVKKGLHNANIYSPIPQSGSYDTLKSVSNYQTGTEPFSSEEKLASEESKQKPKVAEFDSLTDSVNKTEKLHENETEENYQDFNF